MMGWGWLPWRKVPALKKELKDKTVCIYVLYVTFIVYIIWMIYLCLFFGSFGFHWINEDA